MPEQALLLPRTVELLTGTIADILDRPQRFDAVLYIDVLEHIEDDRGELERATRLLREGGYLIVLSPAHQWLFSPFDEAIGHFRRYDRRSLGALQPAGTALRRPAARLFRRWRGGGREGEGEGKGRDGQHSGNPIPL